MGSGEFLGDRKKALEESFFRNLEKQQLEKMRAEQRKSDQIEAMKRISGITDQKVLGHLLELGISTDTFAALTLTPLVEVAWADGEMDEKEKHAILSAAELNDLKKGTAGYDLLESWLDKRPPAELDASWKAYVKGLCASLAKEDVRELRTALLSRAQSVAQAAGGFLGMGSKVSKEERKVLDDLANSFPS